jgi:uncharacterized HAD superfamily protein
MYCGCGGVLCHLFDLGKFRNTLLKNKKNFKNSTKIPVRNEKQGTLGTSGRNNRVVSIFYMTTCETKKPIIAVDIDEVLTPFVKHLLDFYNKRFPENQILLENFHSYQFWEVWGGTMHEANNLVDEFFKSDDFKSQQPLEHAVQTLQKLKERFELVIVTSRQHAIKDHTHEFLDKYYPGIFSSVLMGNHYGKEGVKKSKPDMCKEIGAVLLIDDSLDYARQCAEANLDAILFGDYPWNRTKYDLHENIVRVAHWKDVEQAIDKILEKRKYSINNNAL